MCISGDNMILLTKPSGRNFWVLIAYATGLDLDKNATYKTVKQLTESLGIKPLWEEIEEKDSLKHSQVCYDMISDDDLWRFFKPGNAVALFRKDGIAHWCVVDEVEGGRVQIIHRYFVDSQCPLDDHSDDGDSIMKKSTNAKIVKGSLMSILDPESLDFLSIFKCEDGRDCSDFSVQKARNLLGTPGYNLLFENCEHFVSYCCRGIKSSEQVLWRCAKYFEVISSVVFALMTLALCLLVTSAFSSLLTAVFGILIAIATYFSCYYYAVHRWPLNKIRTLILDFWLRKRENRMLQVCSRYLDFLEALSELKFNPNLFKKMTTKDLDALSKDYIIAFSFIEQTYPHISSVEELPQERVTWLQTIAAMRPMILFCKVWKDVEASLGFRNECSIYDLSDVIMHVSAQLRSEREFSPKPNPPIVKTLVANIINLYLADLLGRTDILQTIQICEDFLRVLSALDRNASTDSAEDEEPSLAKAVLALSQLIDELQGIDCERRDIIFTKVSAYFLEFIKENLKQTRVASSI